MYKRTIMSLIIMYKWEGKGGGGGGRCRFKGKRGAKLSKYMYDYVFLCSCWHVTHYVPTAEHVVLKCQLLACHPLCPYCRTRGTIVPADGMSCGPIVPAAGMSPTMSLLQNMWYYSASCWHVIHYVPTAEHVVLQCQLMACHVVL